MNSCKTFLSALFLAFTISGCATPYYGFTKEEWQNLSGTEQEAVKAEYQNILALQRGEKRKALHEERTQSVIDLGMNGLHSD